MKISTIFTAATTTFALAQARTVQFFTESNDTKVNDRGLYSIHEGAGINYLLLDGEPQNYTITESGEIYISQDSADGTTFDQTLSIVNSPGYFPNLQLSVASNDISWYIEDGYLSGNGSDNFWAAKNTNDPYKFTQNSYAIGLFLDNSTNPYQFSDSTRVKIRADIIDEED